MRVWKHLDRAPRLRSPRAWLMTVGYRAFLDLRSSRSRHRGGAAPAALQELPDSRQPAPGESAERSESAERVSAMVAELPEALRDVVLLHYTGGLTLRQTAAAIGLPVGTVKSRLYQALERLRKKMQ